MYINKLTINQKYTRQHTKNFTSD